MSEVGEEPIQPQEQVTSQKTEGDERRPRGIKGTIRRALSRISVPKTSADKNPSLIGWVRGTEDFAGRQLPKDKTERAEQIERMQKELDSMPQMTPAEYLASLAGDKK